MHIQNKNAILRWCNAHPVLVMASYLLLYLAVFGLLEAWRRPMHLIHCALDDAMPFVPQAVLPYVAWFVWVPAVLLYLLHRGSRPAFWRCFGALVSGITVSLAAFVVYPSAVALRHPVAGSGLCSGLLRLIYAADTSTNVCPSLHVFVTALLLLALLQLPGLGTLARWGNTLLAVAICASTVLIDQHSVIDVVCGLALAVWLYALLVALPLPTVARPARRLRRLLFLSAPRPLSPRQTRRSARPAARRWPDP